VRRRVGALAVDCAVLCVRRRRRGSCCCCCCCCVGMFDRATSRLVARITPPACSVASRRVIAAALTTTDQPGDRSRQLDELHTVRTLRGRRRVTPLHTAARPAGGHLL